MKKRAEIRGPAKDGTFDVAIDNGPSRSGLSADEVAALLDTATPPVGLQDIHYFDADGKPQVVPPGFPAEVDGLIRLANTLQADQVHALLVMVNDSDRSPVTRRAYVRAAMALVEGVTNALKRVALAARGWRTDEVLFTRGEVALLREESYRVNTKGEAEVQPTFIPFGSNIKLALRTFARAQGLPPPRSYADAGWSAMVGAIKIRNRLTHPHLLKDLDVSPEDLLTVESAIAWFLAETSRLFDSAAIRSAAIMRHGPPRPTGE